MFLLVIICLIAAFLPPLVIDALFGMGDEYPLIIVHWTAADVLSYFGTISSAVIAIAGVIFSVRAAGRAQESQLRDSVAPYFSAIYLDQQNKHDAFLELFTKSESDDDNDKPSAGECNGAGEEQPAYQEVETRAIYALLADKVPYKRKLSDDERKHVESDHFIEEIAKGARAVVSNSVIYMPIMMRSVGKGSAVGVRIGVDRTEDAWTGVSSLTLGVDESFYLGVYIDTDEPAVFGDYEIRIAFSDCLGYQYQQTFELHIVREAD